ncbi:MAG: hypothetical protein CSA03_03685 [Bacteroidetes bacterium]|nr:MAG: hypothetical protein CSA03_03685 [Bacteroidota bacterium]
MIFQVQYFLSRETLEGYFDVLGMTYVILALTLIITNVPSIVCNVKIIRYKKQTRSIDLIDDTLSSREINARQGLPSKLLRNFNVIFYGSFLLNYVISTIQVALSYQGDYLVAVFAIITVISGIVMFIDAIVIRNRF